MSKMSYLQLLNNVVEEIKNSDLNWIETLDDFVLKLQAEINQKNRTFKRIC